MNWFDLLLLAIIALSVLAGLAKGFARTSFGLISLVVALVCALWFYPVAGSWVDRWVSSVRTANLIGFCIIFTGVLVLGAIAGKVLEKALQLVHLSWLDRLLGGAFGLVRGILVSALLILLMMTFPTNPPQALARSEVAPYVVHAARGLAAAAPHDIKEGFRKSYEKVRHIWADALKKHRKLPQETL